MLATYKATLHGGHVEWSGDAPPLHMQTQDIEVLVTMLFENPTTHHTSNSPQRCRDIAECLEGLAETGGIFDIEEPVAWQRNLRRDRDLFPGGHDAAD